MFKGRKNMVLLSWKPPEPVPETPFVYRLERQKAGAEDWVQCFSMEHAGALEVSGDCVPCEGDYRFRICTVSEHGRSPHVVFPGSARLGEGALPGLACQQRRPHPRHTLSFLLQLLVPGSLTVLSLRASALHQPSGSDGCTLPLLSAHSPRGGRSEGRAGTRRGRCRLLPYPLHRRPGHLVP